MKPLFLSILLAVSVVRAEVAPLPQPATSFGGAISGDTVYVYGGNTGKAHEFHRECIKGDFFRLNLASDKGWEKLAGGTPLLGAPLVTYRGAIYRVGGMEARNAKGEKNDLRSTAEASRFDPASGKWTPLPPLPEARSSHDLAVAGDTLYAAGGWILRGQEGKVGSEGEWRKTMLTLELHAPERGWKEVPQPFQRRALAVVAHGDRLWFIGGMDEHSEPSREVDWFKHGTGEWGKGPQLPEGTMEGFGAAACSAGGKLLASPVTGKIYALSEDQARWEEIAQLSRPRFFHRLLPVDADRVLAVGGSGRKEQILELEYVSLRGGVSAPASASVGR